MMQVAAGATKATLREHNANTLEAGAFVQGQLVAANSSFLGDYEYRLHFRWLRLL